MLRDLLAAEGSKIGRRHVRTLMQQMGKEAVYRRPRTSKPSPGHKSQVSRLSTDIDERVETFHEMFGLAVGPSEAEPFWIKFLRSLTRRGLRGVKLVISNAHEGRRAAKCSSQNPSLLVVIKISRRALPY